MRNRKFKNEPTGLTGGKLGSWRYNKMKQIQYSENKKYAETVRNEKKQQEKSYVFIENQYGYTFQHFCSVNSETVGDIKQKAVHNMMSGNIYTVGGVVDIEVFYPYCKMAKDNILTLAEIGLNNTKKIYYRVKPGVTVYSRETLH